MRLEDFLLSRCPPAFRLPLKFQYQKLRGRLEPELLFLQNFLKDGGKRAIDIGANQGLYTYMLSRLFQTVEVFEPQVHCTNYIESYISVSPAKINIHHVGLADVDGSMILNIPVGDGDYAQSVQGLGSLTTGLASFRKLEGNTSSVEVPIKKLDDYGFEDVSFIKIDVEGFESKVIEGAKETIINKPILMLEIESRHLEGGSIIDIINQVTNLGYEGYFLREGQLMALRKFYKQLSERQNNFLPNNPQKYINNFIFKPI